MRAAPLLAATAAASAAARPGTRYRAAVVEITSAAVPQRSTADEARAQLLRNAATIDEWAGKAAAAGAQIVVFGEDFADSGWSLSGAAPGSAALYAEALPEPGPASLCTAGDSSTPAASAIACAAQKHGIFIVTGIADSGPCVRNLSPFSREPFPCDEATNRTQFNSIAAFESDGSLAAKYHKSHLARNWGKEYEPQWAEVAPPDVVHFETSFGVRFGMFICNDINLGGPTRALLEAGVRDIIFPTLWINFGPFSTAVGTQDSYARAHGVNLIAANGDLGGRASSGSGIWPADTAAAFVQHYNPAATAGRGWMGVADLVSPAAGPPLPAAKAHPAGAEALVFDAKWFTARAGERVQATAAKGGVACSVDADVAAGGGDYALVAFEGLCAGGWWQAACMVAPCPRGTTDVLDSCVYRPDNLELPTGGAVFGALALNVSAPAANVWWHSALCDGGSVVANRSAVALRDGAGGRTLSVAGAVCPLLAAYVDARAQSEGETQDCPGGRYPCNTGAPRVRLSGLPPLNSVPPLAWPPLQSGVRLR